MAFCIDCAPKQSVEPFTVRCRICEKDFETTNPNMKGRYVNCETCAQTVGFCQICEVDLERFC